MNKNSSGHSNGQKITNGSAKTRGAAIRAHRRNQDDANKAVRKKKENIYYIPEYLAREKESH